MTTPSLDNSNKCTPAIIAAIQGQADSWTGGLESVLVAAIPCRMSQVKSEAAVINRTMSGSQSTGNQSLFNIYYLGQTRVDRRCNSSMMPWIIEELKLKAREMKFIWLSPGTTLGPVLHHLHRLVPPIKGTADL